MWGWVVINKLNEFFEDDFPYCVEEDPKQKLRLVAAPPRPGQRKFHKKVNATKPKKRKR